MAEKHEGTGRFNLKVRPYAEASIQLETHGLQGVDPLAVADAIREHGVAAMPSELQDWLSAYLEGKVTPKRGRPADHALTRNMLLMLKCYHYNRMRTWLQARKKRYGHLKGWSGVRDAGWWEGPPAERAARIVAQRWGYGFHSWRSLQTEVSKKCG